MERPHFEECRRGCNITTADLESLPLCQLLHGWARSPDFLHTFREALSRLPITFQSFHPFPLLPEYHVFVFVDGSCLRPEVPHLRLLGCGS